MILFSSHRLDVVEQLCSRVLILHAGRVVANESLGRSSDTSSSLEEVFARATEQEDSTSVARAILQVIRS
jgi:ABC-2 type transport system ATP-binding protein